MKNKPTMVYLNNEDRNRYQTKADELGLSLSSYLRLVLTQTTKP
jgi:hypothetical protein